MVVELSVAGERPSRRLLILCITFPICTPELPPPLTIWEYPLEKPAAARMPNTPHLIHAVFGRVQYNTLCYSAFVSKIVYGLDCTSFWSLNLRVLFRFARYWPLALSAHLRHSNVENIAGKAVVVKKLQLWLGRWSKQSAIGIFNYIQYVHLESIIIIPQYPIKFQALRTLLEN